VGKGRLQRRDFLKAAVALGGVLLLGSQLSRVAEAFKLALDGKVKVVWLQGAGDTGCTISLLQGAHPDLVDVITRFRLEVAFHPTVMAAQGEAAVKPLERFVEGLEPLDVLIVEGAIPKGEYCTVGEVEGKPVPIEEWVRRLGEKAGVVVAVGDCAAFGGIPAASPNPTGCKPVKEILPGKTVVNISGCPPHPEWIILTLAAVLSGEKLELDEYGRPKVFYSHYLHDLCPRRGFYDRGEFAEKFGEDKCLWKLGCKGPIVKVDCPMRLWNNGVNMCTQNGGICVGCAHPRFPETPLSPFHKEVEAVPAVLGIDLKTWAYGLAGVAALAIALHAIRRKAGTRHPEYEEV